jgi:hypothetical protein
MATNDARLTQREQLVVFHTALLWALLPSSNVVTWRVVPPVTWRGELVTWSR